MRGKRGEVAGRFPRSENRTPFATLFSLAEQKRGAEAPLPGLTDWLELDASGELHLTRVGGITGERAARNASYALDVAARVGEVNMVEGVERIGPELQLVPFADGEVLHRRNIAIEEVRTPSVVTSSIANGVQTRIGKPVAKGLSLVPG